MLSILHTWKLWSHISFLAAGAAKKVHSTLTPHSVFETYMYITEYKDGQSALNLKNPLMSSLLYHGSRLNHNSGRFIVSPEPVGLTTGGVRYA